MVPYSCTLLWNEWPRNQFVGLWRGKRPCHTTTLSSFHYWQKDRYPLLLLRTFLLWHIHDHIWRNSSIERMSHKTACLLPPNIQLYILYIVSEEKKLDGNSILWWAVKSFRRFLHGGWQRTLSDLQISKLDLLLATWPHLQGCKANEKARLWEMQPRHCKSLKRYKPVFPISQYKERLLNMKCIVGIFPFSWDANWLYIYVCRKSRKYSLLCSDIYIGNPLQCSVFNGNLPWFYASSAKWYYGFIPPSNNIRHPA